MSNLKVIDDLNENKLQVEQTNQLNVVLNTSPAKKWVKTNKFANNAKYIPIERVEWLLRRVFGQYKIEVRETQQIFNGIVVTVRLHYLNPVTGEWAYHDGTGAAELQTKRGASANDFSSINTNAIAMCAPKAKTEAVKNAAKTFGKLFGSDLNRKQNVSYDTLANLTDSHPNWNKCVAAVKNGTPIEAIEKKYGKLDDETKKALKNG